MTQKSRLFLITCILVAHVSSEACSDAPPPPKALRCEFETYSSGTAQQNDARINARIEHEAGIDPLTFAAFDIAKGTAQMIGNTESSDVTLIATAFSWSFVEVTETGNVNVTQVFLWDEPNADIGLYRAVHSRHSSIMGSIAVSQHYGRCKVLN